MFRSALLVFLICVCSVLPLIDTASAQGITPSVELECEAVNPSGTLQIHVGPGATLIDYADCTASNPNVYTEKISIEVTIEGLSYSAPGELTIGPNSEVDFQVTIKADAGMIRQTRNLNIKAQVIEAAGLPPPNIAESDVSLIVDIMQFSGVSVESVSPIITLTSGIDYNMNLECIMKVITRTSSCLDSPMLQETSLRMKVSRYPIQLHLMKSGMGLQQKYASR